MAVSYANSMHCAGLVIAAWASTNCHVPKVDADVRTTFCMMNVKYSVVLRSATFVSAHTFTLA